MSVTAYGLPYTPFSQPVTILAPRSVNVPSRFMSASKSSPLSYNVMPFSQRRIKRAPIPSHAQLSESRRQNVLEHVRGRRDDRQFDRRADDMMRSNFLEQQRQREAVLEQEALQHSQVEEEEQVSESDEQPAPADEQDIMLAQEMKELESLLELLPLTETSQADSMDVELDEHSEHYGSDEEDIDSIMQQLLKDYDRSGDDDMDMS